MVVQMIVAGQTDEIELTNYLNINGDEAILEEIFSKLILLSNGITIIPYGEGMGTMKLNFSKDANNEYSLLINNIG